MQHRRFCKKCITILVTAGAGLALMAPVLSGSTGCFAQTPKLSTPTALKLGWRVACEGYSIRDRSLCEAIDALSAMGILNIEPVDNGVKMSKTDATNVDFHMSSAKRSELKNYMADKGVKMPGYYVGYNKASMTDPKLWEFLKEMGVETLCGEPEPGNLAAVEKLSKQFNIPLAVHNHPQGSSTYWNPEEAIKLIDAKGTLPMIGFCPDIGHWARSNIDVLKGLSAFHKSRPIHVVHAKDIRKNSNVDTVLGTGGKVPCKEVFDSLYTWKWQGVITIELEADPPRLRDIDSCARYIENYAKSKISSSVSPRSFSPYFHQGAVRLFVTTGDNASARGHGADAMYTVSGKKAGGSGAARYSEKSGKSAGIYIIK